MNESCLSLESSSELTITGLSCGLLHGCTVCHERTGKQATIRIQRILDVAVSLSLSLALLPLFLVIAIFIRWDSPGPTLFIQKRVGLNGRVFNFFKFRSMIVNAEAIRFQIADCNERSGPVFKMREDPRITRMGRVLRKYSLDELPQLLNVILGDMSLIGPRPALPSEVDLYEDYERGRLAVLPGVTGLWQVSGRADLSFEESIALDLHYIANQTLLLNARILWMTIPAIFTGRGAY